MADVQRIVDEQIAYYRARAAEYDQYYERSGPFDQGPEHKAIWPAELEQATNWMQLDQIQGAVLDVAAGTGWWTSRLAEHATTDGREFTIVKTFWTPEALRARLEPRWCVDAHATDHFFLLGTATPTT